MSRLDPKPGRWILPLVVVGLIAFTAVFVNALPPAEEADVVAGATTTTTEAPPSVTSTTVEVPGQTTTTTIAPEIAAFLTAADTVLAAGADLLTEAEEINQTWEEVRSFQQSLNALRDLSDKTSSFADSVATTEVPEGLAGSWEPVQVAAEAMVEAAKDMVTGLQSSDTGQIRRAALADFGAAVEDLTNAINAATAGIS